MLNLGSHKLTSVYKALGRGRSQGQTLSFLALDYSDSILELSIDRLVSSQLVHQEVVTLALGTKWR